MWTHPCVGRNAVRVTLQPDGVWIYDCGSGGGSRIESDGVQIERPACPLSDGAILWISDAVAFRVGLGKPS